MRLLGLRRTEADGEVAIEADVVWEQLARPPTTLAFRTSAAHGEGLQVQPEAFVAAATWPAWEAGETRLEVEGTLCPRLRDGLLATQQILAGWYDIERPFLRLEATEGWRAPRPVSPPRAAMFLSGGVDSLSLLRQLQDDFPPDHPSAVRDAFFAYGLDMGAPHLPDQHATFSRARDGLAALCREEGIELVTVWTNVRGLEVRGRSWPDAWFGLGTVAIAHAFAARISEINLAASLSVAGLSPAGSHPMLDPYFSSAAVAVRHEGLHLNRLEKSAIVANWPAALRVLRVCYQYTDPDGPLNCGTCRKCVRALLALVALGKLDEAETFPVRNVTPAMLEACTVDRHMVPFYESLLEPLARVGREDLARGLRRRLRAFARRQRWRRIRARFRGR